jgi:hypothetical protein
MRRVLMMLLVVGSATPAMAQMAPTLDAPAARDCRPFNTPPLVNVTMRDGRRVRGTLTCFGNEAELLTEGKLSRLPLDAIAKIAEPRDPVWEGPVIGAAVGAGLWAFCGTGCDNAHMARATVVSALVGLAIDAVSSRNKTIYKGRSPAIGFSLRF